MTGGALWPQGPLEWPVTFAVDGVTYTLPEMPVRSALYALAAESWRWFVPYGLAYEERYELLCRLDAEDDPLDFEHLWVVTTRLLGRLAGTASPENGDGYFPAVRIAQSLVHNWMVFEGWCAVHAVDPLTLPLHRLIALGYQLLSDSCTEEKDFEKLRARVFAPPSYRPAEMPLVDPQRERAMALAVLAEMKLGDSPDDFAPEGDWDS